LRGIDGYSRILLEDYHDQLDEDGRFVLGQVRASAQEMDVLIGDLLEFSRVGRREMRTTTIDMAGLFRETWAELQAAHPDRRLQFRLDPLPPAQGDRAMLREVARNLLGNAVKFTRPREVGVIEVGSKCELRIANCELTGVQSPESRPSAIRNPQSAIVYFVRDNGVGFDMQYADKLFQVFQRLHRAEEFEGTGVGLALVKRIIDRHGGRVGAESERGKGATFYFALPQGKETNHAKQ
jgi:light-regulated signal transduction histidine kinase (bacteriophytochrome)